MTQGWDGTVETDLFSDGSIPPPAQEVCQSVLTQKGKTYHCELHPPHVGWGHSNKEAQAVWE